MPTPTYTGLALPPLRTTGGYFAAQPTKARVLSDLLIVLFSPIGSRPFRRTFGSGLTELPFDQVTQGVVNLVAQGSAATWCPYVSLTSITVVPPSKKQAGVKINYTIPNTV